MPKNMIRKRNFLSFFRTNDMNKINIFEPKGNVNRAVLGLHGYTGNEQSLTPIALGSRCRNTRWYLPAAPFDLPDREGKSWFQKKSSGEWDISSAFSVIRATLDRIQADGISLRKTALLGFSQGACLALEYGLRFPTHFGGLIPVAGFIKYPEQLGKQLSGEETTIPILIIHGEKDTIVPPEKGREVMSFLADRGIPARIHWHHDGHKIPVKALREIKSFVEGL
ncbi:MAG: alpha/beta hydrolase [Fidelibacterota bacterium]